MQVRQRCFWVDDAHARALPDRPIFVDGFAGGGGASAGIKAALGRAPDVAINHNKAAIAMHMANHPETKHYCENIWDVDPVEVCEGRPVAGAWFSPDCTHYSKARGSKPVEKKIRGLAWVVVKWAELVRPDVIWIENVEEFQTWGPVDRETGKPIKAKAGVTFQLWVWKLRELGYEVDWRVLRACDYGTPTTRKRLFIIARCDGQPIEWPAPSHGSPKEITKQLQQRGRCRLRPWRTAATIIDWSIPCPSIFATTAEIKREHGVHAIRPLAEKTLRRIAEGIRRYVIESADPFIVNTAHGGMHFRGQSIHRPVSTVTGHHGYGVIDPVVTPFLGSTANQGTTGRAPYVWDVREPVRTVTTTGDKVLLTPTLVSYYGPKAGDAGHRGRSVAQPLPTQTAENRFALVSAFIAKHFGGMVGVDTRTPFPTITTLGCQNQLVAAHLVKTNHGDKQEFAIDEPLRTVCAGGTHHALVETRLSQVRAFLMKFYSSGGQWSACDQPLPTITAKDRLALGLVTLGGELWQIIDIGMRMLTPRELFSAQGFSSDYRIDVGLNGKPATKTEQVGRCGNSVCPQVVTAIVRANLPSRLRTGATRA